jgi:RNA polymerase sigma-70 factor (ECF subfamily)
MPERAELRDPERHATGRDDLDRIAAILDGLDELSRSILVLRDVEGMSYQQIASTLDIPIPTVKTRLLRARRELQRLAQVGDLA